MEFETYLKKNAREVELALNKILGQFLKDTKKTNPKLLPFAKKLVNSCKGGKRIRGVLVKLGYEIAKAHLRGVKAHLGGEITKVGAAFEILHSALLIHDDIIDKSPKRRGQPSLYTVLGGNHYGISQAISLGDIGLYLPVNIITLTEFSDEIKIRALSYFSKILINTGWGQVMDLEKGKDKAWVNLFKTAKYTVAGPLQIGAILGGAGEKLIRDFGVFGENAGIAFQIKDDMLDKQGGDMSEAFGYGAKAKKMIPDITKNKKMINLLEDMCDYVVERNR